MREILEPTDTTEAFRQTPDDRVRAREALIELLRRPEVNAAGDVDEERRSPVDAVYERLDRSMKLIEVYDALVSLLADGIVEMTPTRELVVNEEAVANGEARTSGPQ
ncbi:MAG: hypothetical protein JWL85_316 [Candidatus Saccharibacteria bacterium]|nr:hypothetical protein [Candidatus Saccharibacteria bacterium]